MLNVFLLFSSIHHLISSHIFFSSFFFKKKNTTREEDIHLLFAVCGILVQRLLASEARSTTRIYIVGWSFFGQWLFWKHIGFRHSHSVRRFQVTADSEPDGVEAGVENCEEEWAKNIVGSRKVCTCEELRCLQPRLYLEKEMGALLGRRYNVFKAMQ